MADIVFGGRENIERDPVMISLINVNSPLRYDERMLGAMFEYVRAGQPVLLTPFLLMGAMSPVSVQATLTQQVAEALAGIALVQLIRPGAPVIFGSFLSNNDMQSGAPAFGTPESAVGLLCTGQIARHYGLPFRSGGGLTASTTCDAQAAYEALMTMLPTFLAGTNWVMHSAGWLESGLASCYEKFIVDIEILRMMHEEFKPFEITEESLAWDAHQEVGHGGHFFGAAHTLEHFRDCFYRPLLSSTMNFERWQRLGGDDATDRAAKIWRETVDNYERPPLDDAISAGARRVRHAARGTRRARGLAQVHPDTAPITSAPPRPCIGASVAPKMIALATVVATGSLVDSRPVSDGPTRSRPAKNIVNAIRLTNATATIQIQPVGWNSSDRPSVIRP